MEDDLLTLDIIENENLTLTRKDMLVDFYYVRKKNITMYHFKDIDAIRNTRNVVFVDTDGSTQKIK